MTKVLVRSWQFRLVFAFVVFLALCWAYLWLTLEEAPKSHRRQFIYLTYGSNCCVQAQQRACKAALQYGFTQCIAANTSSLSLQFREENKKVLEQPRGAGYWIWKVRLILDVYETMHPDDILVYADAGSVLIHDPIFLLGAAQQEESGILLFGLCHHKMRSWCKRDAFILAEADEAKYHDASQFLASFIVVRPTHFARVLLERWLQLCLDKRALTDIPNELGKANLPEFRDHRHDQALLSLVALKMGYTPYRDPSQYGECDEKDQPLPMAVSKYPTTFHHDRFRD